MRSSSKHDGWSLFKLNQWRSTRTLAILLLWPVAALAGGVVTNCTEAALRAAMAESGTVIFACNGAITLTTTITNNANVTLDGTGHQVTISGGNAVRVFSVPANTILGLVNLTIANGLATNGAGILNSGGTLNATNCTFSRNTASETGSEGAQGGAILNCGLLQLQGCNFAGNQARVDAVSGNGGGGGSGGAIYNCTNGTGTVDLCTFTGNLALGANGTPPGLGWTYGGSGLGGAICNDGILVVRRSRFAGNEVRGGAGGAEVNLYPGWGGDGKGGAICNQGSLWMDSSTVATNSATGGSGGAGFPGQSGRFPTNGGPGGPGGLGAGSGLFNSGTATAINCTFAGNSVVGGYGGPGGPGGIGPYYPGQPGPDGPGADGLGAIYSSSGSLYLTNCTLALNAARAGGGYTTGMAAGGIKGSGCLLLNTLLAANATNCSGWITDAGHNLSSDGTCNFTNLSSLNNTDVKLGELSNNGGPTVTMALLPGSPAIDAGDASLAPATDQRGFPRPAGLAADIGAFEYGSVMPTLTISRSGATGLDLLGTGNANQPCRLLMSTDLLSWVPVATNQFGGAGTVLFYETCALGGAGRFYRLVMP